MGRNKKRDEINRRILGMDVIAIDDGPNGYSFGNKDGPLVYGGYLTRNFQGESQPLEKKCYKKGGMFTGKLPLNKVKERVRYIFRKYPDFYYTSISNEEINEFRLRGLMPHRRGKAMASVMLKFYLEYGLTSENTFVIFDTMDRLDIDYAIEITGDALFTPKFAMVGKVRGGKSSEKEHPLLRTIDRIMYHLVGVEYRSDNGYWPRRDRMLDIGEHPYLMHDSHERTLYLEDKEQRLEIERMELIESLGIKH